MRRTIVILLVLMPCLALGGGPPLAPDPAASPEALWAQFTDARSLASGEPLLLRAAMRIDVAELDRTFPELVHRKASYAAAVDAVARALDGKPGAEPLTRVLVRYHAFRQHRTLAPHEVVVADLEAAIRASGAALEAVACAEAWFRAMRPDEPKAYGAFVTRLVDEVPAESFLRLALALDAGNDQIPGAILARAASRMSPEAFWSQLGADAVRTTLLGPTARRLGVREPDGAFGSLVARKARWQDAVAEVAGALGSTDGAEALTRVVVRYHAFRTNPELAPHDAVIADLEAAVRASHGALIAVACAEAWFRRMRPAGSDGFAAFAARMQEHVPARSFLLVELAADDVSDETLLRVLERDASLAVQVANKADDVSLAMMPAFEVAIRTLLAESRAASEVVDLVVKRFTVLVRAGLVAEAIASLGALPTEVRDSATVRLGLELAAADFVVGRRDEAARVFARDVGFVPGERLGVRGALLDVALHPERDPTDAAAAVIGLPLPWPMVSALVAEQNAPALAANARRAIDDLLAPANLSPGASRTAAARRSYDEKRAALRAVWAARGAASPALSPSADPVSATLDRLLSAPPLDACTERDPTRGRGRGLKDIAFATRPGFQLVTASVRGRDGVALFVSASVDGGTSGSLGGYWFARTSDAGRGWSKPVYLGLRDRAPYLAGRRARPAIEGDSLVFSVSRASDEPLDVHSVKSAWTNIEPTRELSCPLATLARDTDGDGLSDLVEERLLTDPEHQDTDRDGLSDAVDPLPHVPVQGRVDVRGLAALVELQWGQPRDSGPLDEFRASPTPVVDETRPVDTLLFERGLLTGLARRGRTLVLTAPEHARALKKFGSFPARTTHPVEVDAAGTRARVARGGACSFVEYVVRQKGAGWWLEVVGWEQC